MFGFSASREQSRSIIPAESPGCRLVHPIKMALEVGSSDRFELLGLFEKNTTNGKMTLPGPQLLSARPELRRETTRRLQFFTILSAFSHYHIFFSLSMGVRTHFLLPGPSIHPNSKTEMETPRTCVFLFRGNETNLSESDNWKSDGVLFFHRTPRRASLLSEPSTLDGNSGLGSELFETGPREILQFKLSLKRGPALVGILAS
ncbi:hypothetical protein BX600DRAFT_472074 [Xylariales sp. PMI_506]|nr:hypothetical protein BX600DRAFT_472074 [Xylariales sp. PMI_506]